MAKGRDIPYLLTQLPFIMHGSVSEGDPSDRLPLDQHVLAGVKGGPTGGLSEVTYIISL